MLLWLLPQEPRTLRWCRFYSYSRGGTREARVLGAVSRSVWWREVWPGKAPSPPIPPSAMTLRVLDPICRLLLTRDRAEERGSPATAPATRAGKVFFLFRCCRIRSCRRAGVAGWRLPRVPTHRVQAAKRPGGEGAGERGGASHPRAGHEAWRRSRACSRGCYVPPAWIRWRGEVMPRSRALPRRAVPAGAGGAGVVRRRAGPYGPAGPWSRPRSNGRPRS